MINSEKRKAYLKDWYKKNRKKKLAQNKAWYWDNRERALETSKEWYINNKEFAKEHSRKRCRKYYQKNKKEKAEYQKKYQKNNKEKCARARWKYYHKGNGKWIINPQIIIAEKMLGRKLKEEEIVHHINLNNRDNRLENLLICSRNFHKWLHHQMKIRGITKESFII